MARFRDFNKEYRNKLEKFRLRTDISENTKNLILDFLRDCELGKTLQFRSKKKIGPYRCYKVLNELLLIHKMLEKDFDKVTQRDMEDFILGLENDVVRRKEGGYLC